MKKFLNEIYKRKKIFVTGHTGFKGAWLSFWLTSLGAEVIGYSLQPSTTPNMFNVLNLEKDLTSIIGDIRNKESLEKVLNKYKPDYIFHLAAQPLVRKSYHEPHLTFETNVMGTVNLLEAARKSNFEGSIINITSDKCYKNTENICNFKENDPMGGYDPYSSSKGASELVTSAYRNSFFNPENYNISHKVALASARAGNVIGGGDWSEDRLIPDFVRALSKNEEIIIRNPHAIRPWQHVMECISGYLWLGAKLSENAQKYSESWNFGPDEDTAITVEEIVLKSIKLWGKGNYKIVLEKNLKEAVSLKLDISKAKEKLNWQPIYNINQSLEKTIDWYKNFYEFKSDMYEYTKNQIEEYIIETDIMPIN